MTPAEYKLLLTRTQKLTLGVPLIMFTLVPLAFLFFFYSAGFEEMPTDNQTPFFPAFPLVLFLVFAGFYAWSILSLPHRISVTRDGKLIFKSLLRSRAVKVSHVLSIEPRNLNIQVGLSGYLLKHRDGKIVFPGQFTGQYILLHELKQANPTVEIKGC